jgi:hypothetical protein
MAPAFEILLIIKLVEPFAHTFSNIQKLVCCQPYARNDLRARAAIHTAIKIIDEVHYQKLVGLSSETCKMITLHPRKANP